MASRASESPTVILANMFRSACLNGRLKTIIAILEYHFEDGTKLRPPQP